MLTLELKLEYLFQRVGTFQTQNFHLQAKSELRLLRQSLN
jgi:hypothetical protein